MAQELIARCDNCVVLKTEGNNWWMGTIFGQQTLEIIITHYDHKEARGKQTWCGIPCIQQVIGKALEANLNLQPCLNPAPGGITGRIKSEEAIR